MFRLFAESSNKGPASLEGRDLKEDVFTALVLFSYIGESIGVCTSVADSLIQIAPPLLGIDFYQGRTIKVLLQILSQDDINDVITK